VSVLEDPVRDPFLVNKVPPSKANHESSSHVLDSPEVHGNQENDRDINANKGIGEEASKEIDHEGQAFEEDVEEGSCWMTRQGLGIGIK